LHKNELCLEIFIRFFSKKNIAPYMPEKSPQDATETIKALKLLESSFLKSSSPKDLVLFWKYVH